MNIIFMTLAGIENIESRGIYADLMRKFRNEGHQVYIVTQRERRLRKPTELKKMDGVQMLHVRTLNITKTNVVEKGLGTLLIESQYRNAIRKYLNDVTFDVILYSTPPITFTNVVKYLKKKNPSAISYLLLKDIFPQNAVDIGMIGMKSVFNWYFRRMEMALYRVSDFIGCMSPANVKYVLDHNDFVKSECVEVAPNSIELVNHGGANLDNNYYHELKTKYKLPTDRPIFIYGGNLGKPQGIPFLVECLKANANRKDCHFLIIGSGTELPFLKSWFEETHPSSVTVMEGLPKSEYDELVRACDVGLIFLDHRFTIPNYPSRLLSYLENRMPVICATDVNSDMGKIAEENGFGYWCESVKPEDFTDQVDKMMDSDRKKMGEKGYEFLKKNYLVDNTYNIIKSHIVRTTEYYV